MSRTLGGQAIHGPSRPGAKRLGRALGERHLEFGLETDRAGVRALDLVVWPAAGVAPGAQTVSVRG